ncbi:MAG: hypothetical protein AAGI01_16875 [Myxococcota bacterium]
MTDPVNLQGAALIERVQEMKDSAPTEASDGRSFADALSQKDGVQAPDTLEPAHGVEAPDAPERIDASKRLDDFLKSVGEDQTRIEAMMSRCVDGQTLSQQELLELQSVIYGYAQKVELASKLVDKATGGLKQVMNTQV